MIEVIEGRLGGGKSYFGTIRAVGGFEEGRQVFTNLALVWGEIKKFCGLRGYALDDEQFVDLESTSVAEFQKRLNRGALVILDEAHLWFNARDWQEVSRELLAFQTQSRKYGVDIIFITQHADNLDKQFRRLVGKIWRVRNLTDWRVPGLGFKCPFDLSILYEIDYDGKTLLGHSFIWRNKQIYQLFNTNAVYKMPFELGEAKRFDVRKKKQPQTRRQKVFKLGLICLVAFVLGAGYWWHRFTRPKQRSAPGVASAAGGAVPVQAPLQVGRTIVGRARGFVAFSDGQTLFVGTETPYGYFVGDLGDRLVFQRDGRQHVVELTALGQQK